LTVLLAACSRDNSKQRNTENASNTAGAATTEVAIAPVPETSSSAADVPPPNPRDTSTIDVIPEKFSMPPWARTPQPAVPSALFARGITGPINESFEGLLACQISVSGANWDNIVPFIDSPAVGLPDIRIHLGGAVVLLPDDTPSGTATFAGMTITKDSRLVMDVSDWDAFQNDPIGVVSLDASRGFPMEGKTPSMTVVCRGVPRSALTAEIKPREAALERALVAMEKSPAPIDLARPEISRKGIDAAEKAVLELAAYVGFEDANVKSGLTRITAVETSQKSRYAEAIDAELAKHLESEFQSLPSGRVRCHPTKPGVVEVEVGARALQHDWAAKNLGPLQFRFISKSGVELAPAFDSLFVDNKKLEDASATIPAKGKVDVELRLPPIGERSHAIVVREGSKRVFLCPYAGK